MTTDPTPAQSATAVATEPLPALPLRPSSDFRRWVAFGTGVGVEIQNGALHAVISRVRPSRVSVLGALSIPEFRSRPATEWGQTVQEFLRRNAAGHIAATVLLPRNEVIVRQVSLPGVSNRDLEAAVRLQIDSLHPFGEDDVYFSWARIGVTSAVLVGIVRREVLDGYSALFAEAGLKVSMLTFPAAVMYSAVRLITVPPAEFVVVHPAEGAVEVFGESPSRPVYSALLPVSQDRAAGLAKSELRIHPDTPALDLAGVVPRPESMPAGLDRDVFDAFLMAYATSLCSACPWLVLDGNLLPSERRRASSRLRLIPTFTLTAILTVLLVLLALQSTWADRRYLGVLQYEIRRHEPVARRVEQIDKTVLSVRARSQALDDFRRRAKLDMDVLAEVTRLIPPPGWVSGLEMDRNTVQLAGEMDQAAPLLEAFDKSPLFQRTEFTMPISRTAAGEMFRIRTLRETPPPAAVTTPPAAAPAKAGAK